MVWRAFGLLLLVALFLLLYNSCLVSKPPEVKIYDCPPGRTLGVSLTQGRNTSLDNIVFGIGSNAGLWDSRKEFVRVWWQKDRMRGYVWLDKPVAPSELDNRTLPELKVSSDTRGFRYTYTGTDDNVNKHHVRMSRVVSEMVRLGVKDVHWFVMADDDTYFVPENLVMVLSKYDHNEAYYIGSISESHRQNVGAFSSNMAYGGAGYAISYSLAVELEKMQDECLERYHHLYSADARIYACLAELGVSLTVEKGLHQFDVYGDATGLLASHPSTPFLSMHHLELIDPVFPNMSRVDALKHLSTAVKVDPLGMLQQSFYYDEERDWTIKISWGYVVQVIRGRVPPQDLEVPQRTFTGWYHDRDETGVSFKTLAVADDPCKRPLNFFMSSSDKVGNWQSRSAYTREERRRECSRRDELSRMKSILVYKQVAPSSWLQAPRRQCCRIISRASGMMQLQVVGSCKLGQIV